MSDELYGSHFTLPAARYKRDLDTIKYYVEDASHYLHLSTGKPLEQCTQFVKESFRKGGRFEFKDPKVTYLERGENGDREKKETTLRRYIQDSIVAREFIAPTFTTYVDQRKQKSILSSYVEMNIAKRGIAKKEQFAAKAAKQKELETLKKIEQTGRKLANNAISGAFVSASTPLYNKTAHSTLTSTCRTTSGYGNANNEKFLSGNRHYHSHQVVINNIMAVIGSMDYTRLQLVMEKYNIHYPSIAEVMHGISYSTNLYWWDRPSMFKIEELVKKLSEQQRAAFLYSGDAHQLLQHNPELMRTLLTRLSDKVTGEHPEPLVPLRKAPESYINLAHQICYKETAGIGKDYSKIEGTPALSTLALTVVNIAQTVFDYRDLIECLWMPETVPASVGYFPDSIRRAAVTSDTDSTIFTVQDWLIWYSGKIQFDQRSKGVYAAVVFLASSTITHVLAKMSANLGVIEKYTHSISMKSEFSFDVFVATRIGKHYFSCISCQEGNVNEEFDYEIKGVNLRSANAPREINQKAEEMMKKIIHDVIDTGSIKLFDYLRAVADIEREVSASILKGEQKYLRSGSLKDAASYTKEAEESPYAAYYFWRDVWADKYGAVEAPPYSTRKIPLDLKTPTKVASWLASIEDAALRSRLRNYLQKTDKTSVGTFIIPTEILNSKGLPPELQAVVDVNRLTLDICRIFYIILETLGYYAVGKKSQKLVSQNGF